MNPVVRTACLLALVSGCTGSTESESTGTGGELGLLDFKNVNLVYEDAGQVYYACADSIWDDRCNNSSTHQRPMLFPSAFDAHAIVKDVTSESITIVAQDNRLLLPPNRSIHIHDVTTGWFDLGSRAGIEVEYRVDGDSVWQETAIDTQGNGPYWSEVTIRPTFFVPNEEEPDVTGSVDGRLLWCSGNDCSEQQSGSFMYGIPSDAAAPLVEVRLTVVPVKNYGQFDAADYRINFIVGDADVDDANVADTNVDDVYPVPPF